MCLILFTLYHYTSVTTLDVSADIINYKPPLLVSKPCHNVRKVWETTNFVQIIYLATSYLLHT